MKKIILFSFFWLCFAISFAQNPVQDTSKIVKTDSVYSVKWYLYAGIGGGSYSGDLESYQRWTGMFHLGIQGYRNRRINPRLELFYGTIAGQNSLYSFPDATPNKFFQTEIYGATASVQINIIKSDIFTVYFSQGLGLAGFTVSDKNGNDLAQQTETRELSEIYSSPIFMLPTNIGGTAFFQNRFGLGVEFGFLNTMTDYLDNIAKFGNVSGNDNVMRLKLSFYAPISWKKELKKTK